MNKVRMIYETLRIDSFGTPRAEISPVPSYTASAQTLNQQQSHPRLLKELTTMPFPTLTYI